MVDSGHVTATLRLTVGDLQVVHPITVPTARVPATVVIPALQALVNSVVSKAEERSETEGRPISCRKGCGACCRQLVPVSRTEGERLLTLVETLPASRRAALAERFAAASKAMAETGLRETLLDPGARDGKTDRELATSYFALGIACPFLEDESCSIHADRPLVCREYLVTSPAELCAGPAQEGVTPVPVPKVSLAARGLEEKRPEVDTSRRWFPLALLMDWSKQRSRNETHLTGHDWMDRFLKRIGR